MSDYLRRWLIQHQATLRTASAETISAETLTQADYRLVAQVDVSGRRLSSLPSHFDELYNLEVLNLSRNLLDELPEVVYELRNLRELQLSRNSTPSISHRLGQLRSLRGLYASRNHISELPPELGSLSLLRTLNLRNNALSILPAELYELEGLDELDVSENDITALSDNLEHLRRLRNLYLSGNDLTSLPKTIGQLTALESLAISGNQIEHLPRSICNLGNLKSFWVYDNPLVTPPVEIAARGLQDIRAYFYALDKGAGKLRKKTRALILGPPGAGKTSLVDRLVTDRFGSPRRETLGVKITPWYDHGNESEMLLWDFGGQSYMHAAHRLFLGGGEVCIAVVDGRDTSGLEYWIQLVGAATSRHVEAHVVINKVDVAPSADVDRHFLASKYPMIKSFHRTSCKTRYGLAELKQRLRQVASEQIARRQVDVPVTWALVSDRLSRLPNSTITVEAFRELCVGEGCIESSEQTALLNFLWNIGSVVVLDRLRPWAIIVSPQWILDAVYSVITSELARSARGYVPEEAALSLVKRTGVYSDDECRVIIDVLKEYDFALSLPGHMILIPEHLPDYAPESLHVPEDGTVHHIIKVEGDTAFLHARVLSRLSPDVVVDSAWRRGALLRSSAVDAQGLLVVDEVEREIRIRCWGPGRISYLGYIRLVIRNVASDFGDIELTELIPLAGVNATVEYDEVLGLYLMGEREICLGKAGVRRDIQALLFGVDNQGGRLLMNGPVYNFDRSAVTFGAGTAMNINSGEMKSVVAQLVHELLNSASEESEQLARELSDAAVEGDQGRLKRAASRTQTIYSAATPASKLASTLGTLLDREKA